MTEQQPPVMPGMPGMPSTNVETLGTEPTSIEGLVPPEHDQDEKPEIDNVDKNISTTVELPIVPERKGIEVIAMRAGFFGQHRKREGDKFTVSSSDKLGEWMKCIDPVKEKERIKFFKEKKKGDK